jgi:hypothetical protein
MSRLAPVLAVVACLAGVATAAPAATQDRAPRPVHETARSGAVAATLDYVRVSAFEARDVRVSITRDGAAALTDDPLGRACRACRRAMPIGGFRSGGDARSLFLRDLTGDGEPEALVDLYTGGAHCCSITAIYGWDAGTGSYRRLIHDWGDPGYTIEDLTGGPGAELLTADVRFAYAFCAYACSAMPGQVLRYEDFRLVDVTTEFPGRIRDEIRSLRGSLREIRRGPTADRFTTKGILPALCANLHLLDRGAECRAELRTALRRGEVSREPGDIGPSGRRYVRDVLRFLRKTGYRRP